MIHTKLISFFVCLFAVCLTVVLSDGHNRSRWRGNNSRGSRSHSHERRGGPRRETYPWPRGGWPPWYKESTTPSPQDTCPCVRRKDTGECVTYDPRFQAVTVEEAILNFPDLQINALGASTGRTNGSNTTVELLPPSVDAGGFGPVATSDNLTFNGATAAKRVGPKKVPEPATSRQQNASAAPSATSVPTPSLCGDDRQCQECSAALVSRLSGSGLLQGEELDEVSKKFGVQKTPRRRDCDKYRFGKPPTERYMKSMAALGANASSYSSDPALDNLLQQLQAKGEENWRKRQQTQSNRTKRQSTSKAGTTLGQQFKIDCSKRGEPVEQGSTWVGLCNVCWAWRKLPASYFPQYVNELICDTDTKCMSGFGTCQQRYKSVDILQNTGTTASPVWKQVTISVANYCDCEVESGSGMHNFVAA